MLDSIVRPRERRAESRAICPPSTPSINTAAAQATGRGPGDQAARWYRRVRTRDGVDRA